MSIPALFTARGGVVLFRMRPVPDWVVEDLRKAIVREGLNVPMQGDAFGVWQGALEQLTQADDAAQSQRRLTDNPPPRAA
ncbi:hypothetical protein [Caulobacter hibisci]|uniref:Uncharacterized protein n=1 Tax=Caulobacter hibisci TaxID=2035993 RepID=A0ABS0SRU2_9CAUL|nr:hypothetical protein [Caulobacter hibisci]MBI1682345.1 hypothetical protein [Caulobacter hibisci]